MNDSGTITRKAIETEYNGLRFRSRLEARWAVFFDSMGIKYQYEPEGFEFSDGTRYLPDFYLPESDVYFEVKGVMKGEDIKKILNLCKSGANVLVGDNDFNIRSPLEYVIPQLSLEFAVKDAKKNAKQARFEHGEKPKANLFASTITQSTETKDFETSFQRDQAYVEKMVVYLCLLYLSDDEMIRQAKELIKPEFFHDEFLGSVYKSIITMDFPRTACYLTIPQIRGLENIGINVMYGSLKSSYYELFEDHRLNHWIKLNIVKHHIEKYGFFYVKKKGDRICDDIIIDTDDAGMLAGCAGIMQINKRGNTNART